MISKCNKRTALIGVILILLHLNWLGTLFFVCVLFLIMGMFSIADI